MHSLAFPRTRQVAAVPSELAASRAHLEAGAEADEQHRQALRRRASVCAVAAAAAVALAAAPLQHRKLEAADWLAVTGVGEGGNALPNACGGQAAAGGEAAAHCQQAAPGKPLGGAGVSFGRCAAHSVLKKG